MTVSDALFHECQGEIAVLYAGEPARSGSYLNVESGQIVDLEEDGVLPASMDGRVAAYVLAPSIWGNIKETQQESPFQADIMRKLHFAHGGSSRMCRVYSAPER